MTTEELQAIRRWASGPYYQTRGCEVLALCAEVEQLQKSTNDLRRTCSDLRFDLEVANSKLSEIKGLAHAGKGAHFGHVGVIDNILKITDP